MMACRRTPYAPFSRTVRDLSGWERPADWTVSTAGKSSITQSLTEKSDRSPASSKIPKAHSGSGRTIPYTVTWTTTLPGFRDSRTPKSPTLRKPPTGLCGSPPGEKAFSASERADRKRFWMVTRWKTSSYPGPDVSGLPILPSKKVFWYITPPPGLSSLPACFSKDARPRAYAL